MVLQIQPPAGSIIKVESQEGATVLSWPNPTGGIVRWLVALFLTGWLGMWAFGWVAVTKELVFGAPKAVGPMVFWLLGWTVGGIFAIYTLFNLLKPAKRERVTLGVTILTHEPGSDVSRLVGNMTNSRRNTNYFSFWNDHFSSRKTVKIHRQHLGEIRLDSAGDRQRLTIDYGAERIEIGEFLREPEREWLAQVLKDWKSSAPALHVWASGQFPAP